MKYCLTKKETMKIPIDHKSHDYNTPSSIPQQGNLPRIVIY
jgi:hypothetical protein